VLALLEQGLFLKEIGPRLTPPISINTVKKHCGRVFRKLGAGNSREALWRLRYLGIQN
jgi:DNA-binding NarL/FixJ family response regulator